MLSLPDFVIHLLVLDVGVAIGWCLCALMHAAGRSSEVAEEIMARQNADADRQGLNRDIIDLDDRRGITEQPERGRGA